MTPRADKIQKMSKMFEKLEKNCKKNKFAFLASGCSSVASHGAGGGERSRLGGSTAGGNSAVGGGVGQ